MTKGWLKIKEPKDLETAIQRMINKILTSEDPLEHAGKFAHLANCWLSAKRLEYEVGEWQEIKARLELVEQAQAFHSPKQADDFRSDMAELKRLMKEMA